MIEMTCMAANAYAIARAEALQGAVISRFEERGTNVRTYSDEQIAAFREASNNVLGRWAEQDEMFGRVYTSMMDFQAELRPWREMGYLPRDWQTRIGE